MKTNAFTNLFCSVLLLLLVTDAFAQRNKRTQRVRTPQQELIYDNINYLPEIRSVNLYPESNESGIPVLHLNEDNKLILTFDDLRADVRNFYFSLTHCTADWKNSNLSPLEYISGYNEDRIDHFKPSVNTLQAYTNYQVEIPSKQVRPTRSGNYLLQVYEDADKKRLVLTRRLYVVESRFSLVTDIIPSTDNSKRNRNQKLNLILQTNSENISNPHQDLQILVMQNQREDNKQWLRTPSFVSPSELRYTDQRTLDFEGGNEFRNLDLRSLRFASEHIAQLQTDSLVLVDLHADKDLSNLAYGSLFDENGRFYIRNQDRDNAPEEADYAMTTFSLETSELNNDSSGRIYLVGGFNAYHPTEEHRLHYDARSKRWQVTLPLKQGVYNYEYSYVDQQGKQQPFRFSGSYFQTGNDYQILIYYRRPGTTWDELWGFSEVQTSARGR